MKLYNLVTKNSDKFRFHTPGHGGKKLGKLNAKYDITELPFSDNLQNPQGVIAEAEAEAAKIYNVPDMLFFSSGSTTAVFTALAAAAEICDTVYLHGVAHKSFYVGAELAGLNVTYPPPPNGGPPPFAKGGIDIVFVTSPDYFGVTVPEEEMAELRKNAKILIIDSAHGAHYNFSPLLPYAHQSMADLVIMSPHKTLPALTGGAVLAVNNQNLLAHCKKHRGNLHTTSPSYPVLASIDYGISFMAKHGEKLYDSLFVTVEKAKKTLTAHGFKFYENDDFTRLVLDLGEEAELYANRLNEKKIYHELLQENLLVFILTPFNAKYIKKLVKELIRIKGR